MPSTSSIARPTEPRPEPGISRESSPMREPIITGRSEADEPEPEPRRADPLDEKLRPQRLSEVVGQRSVAERLSIALEASKRRGEPLPHILFDGPPGLGK